MGAIAKTSFLPILGLLAGFWSPLAAADCNRNGADDADDIAAATSADCNADGVPDECEFAPLQFGLREAGFPVRPSPQTVVAADLNGDGFADIATGNQARDLSSTISIALNRGDAGFEPAVEVAAGERLVSIAAADLDLDGDIDLAVAQFASFLILENLGAASFRPQTGFDTLPSTRAVAAADLTGDGLPDLLLLNAGLTPLVSVLVNGGGLAFSTPISHGAGDSPAALATADFDGDGDLDVAISDRTTAANAPVSILLNDGAGALGAAVAYASGGTRPGAIAAGDLDGDGDADLVVATFRSFSVLLNGGAGAFGPPIVYNTPPDALLAVDLERDGDLDIALVVAATRTMGVWVNAGDGRFLPAASTTLATAPRSLCAGDFDGDGDLDLAGASVVPDQVTVLWNGEQGTIAMRALTAHVGDRPHAATIGDMDGDATPDVITANGSDRTLSILISRADGTVAPPVNTATGSYMNSVAAGDLNGDGDLELVTADPKENLVKVFERNPNNTMRVIQNAGAGAGAFMVTTGDTSGDGWLDIITANEGGSITVLTNDGQGLFGGRRDLRAGSRPVAVVARDLDGDADVDLAVANDASANLSVLLNSGGGAFSPAVHHPVPGRPLYVAAGDLDGDFDLDLAAASGSTRAAVVLLNGGSGTFGPPVSFDTGAGPYSLITADVDGDGVLDLITANQSGGSVSLLLGDGGGVFAAPYRYDVGADPRFVLAGDLDADGDTDLFSANHTSRDVTLLYNQSAAQFFRGDYLETICTGLDYEKVSVAARGGRVDRSTKYVLPARNDPLLLPPVFQNSRRYQLHQEFLTTVFPDRFPGLTTAEYTALVGARATRQYFVGAVSRLHLETGPAYGFSVFTDLSRPVELLTLEEVRDMYVRLGSAFRLRPLGYFPDSDLARQAAARWADPPFPVYLVDTAAGIDYQAYTRAVGYGRVRVLDRAGFELANLTGAVSFQNILVLDHAPADIEGVVGGVITGAPQLELSHLSVRTARRRTPNAFVRGATEALARWDGRLVRLEVKEAEYLVREAAPAEAEEFWRANRPRLKAEPLLDPDFARLSSLREIDLAGAVPPEGRFGGKTTNLARLSQLVLAGTPFERYEEVGFGIPMRYYLEFLRSNRMPSALDPSRQVTYEEHLRELFAAADFQNDSAVRHRALAAFREYARDHGVVSRLLTVNLAARIAEVFGSNTVMVRFRSSSNVEDALEFNGAGLYESTSACAADELDGEPNGPSRCNASETSERDITRALKRVWTSLWTFRAYEERAYYGIPQERVAMGILVSRAFLDERANGVAFTGNPSNPNDRNYVVTVQAGEASVVSPEPGVTAEKDTLEVIDGRVARIIRPAIGSSLVPPGTWVLADAELEELGALLAFVDARFPLELGTHARDEVLLDFEFKFGPDGALAVKQVRPFLLASPPTPAPAFELVVPERAAACGVFNLAGAGRGPREEYELKSTVRFRAGSIQLPAARDSFQGDLFEEVLFGPEQALATPRAPGLFRVLRVPQPGGVTTYRFSFEQDFVLPDGRGLRLEILPGFEYAAREAEPIERVRALDDELLMALPGREPLRGSIEGVEPLIGYGPCGHASLPLWRVEAELEDGSTLRFDERFQPTENNLDTGPASLRRADLTLRGASRVVADYWDLVYSASRHNCGVRYWVVLDPPARIEGIEAPVRAVEFVALEEPPCTAPGQFLPPQARYLGEGFEVLAAPAVTGYRRAPVDEPGGAAFRRGDADGTGGVNLTDAVFLLTYLFLEGPAPGCLESADGDDNGVLNLTDGLYLLNYLFLDGEAPPEPFAACGPDPSPDALGCASFRSCN